MYHWLKLQCPSTLLDASMDNSPSPLDTHILVVYLWDSVLCRYSLDQLAFDQQWTNLLVFDKWKGISQYTVTLKVTFCPYHAGSLYKPAPGNPGTSCIMVIALPSTGLILILSKMLLWWSATKDACVFFFLLVVKWILTVTVTESECCHFMCTLLTWGTTLLKLSRGKNSAKVKIHQPTPLT